MSYEYHDIAMKNLLDKQTVIFCGKVKMEQIIRDELPSVTPQEPKMGHWIPVYPPTDPRDDQKCSECGQIYPGATRYCPDCGAKMVEPQESEE